MAIVIKPIKNVEQISGTDDRFNFNNPWLGNLYLNDQAGKDFPDIFKINLLKK